MSCKTLPALDLDTVWLHFKKKSLSVIIAMVLSMVRTIIAAHEVDLRPTLLWSCRRGPLLKRALDCRDSHGNASKSLDTTRRSC